MNDLDYPSIYRKDPTRAREIENVARRTEWQRQHEGRVSIYGTVGALIALAALGFVVALCVATAATVARP